MTAVCRYVTRRIVYLDLVGLISPAIEEYALIGILFYCEKSSSHPLSLVLNKGYQELWRLRRNSWGRMVNH